MVILLTGVCVRIAGRDAERPGLRGDDGARCRACGPAPDRQLPCTTAESELASDIGTGAGPYVKVLAEEIFKPGIEAVTMFRRVQVPVRSAIGQEPWLGFSALGEVCLAGVVTHKPPRATPPGSARLSEAAEAWRGAVARARIAPVRCEGIETQVKNEHRCLKPGAVRRTGFTARIALRWWGCLRGASPWARQRAN